MDPIHRASCFSIFEG